MAIKLDKRAREAVLERAMRDARSPTVTADATWTSRAEWLSAEVAGGDAKGKTYVAAVGGALLAKATDPRVDSVTQTERAGARGYSLRSTTELMQDKVRGRVHLGTLSRNPLNNAPFNRGPTRIDRFTVAPYLRHVFDEFLGWMQELDAYRADEAYGALVAFLRVRMRVQKEEDQSAAVSIRMNAARSTADLLDAVQLWMADDPEEGARGQTVVAAALDLVWTDVQVIPQHHPAPFDIRREGKPPPLVGEVKQRLVDERDVLELGRRAAESDADLALFAALHPSQRPLPVGRLRVDCLAIHGVLLDVVQDIDELIAHLCVHAGVKPQEVAARLPQQLVDRAPGAGVSGGGTQRLAALLRGVGA